MRRRMGRPGLVGTMARTAVVAGTATAVVGGMQGKKQAQAQAQQQQAAAAAANEAQMADMQAQVSSLQAQQAPAPAPAPAAAGAGGVVEELEKLAALKTAGILSDEEFAAAKAKLLS